jgi:hypothetical protein
MSRKLRRVWMEKKIWEMEIEDASPDVEYPDFSKMSLAMVEHRYDEWFGEGSARRLGELCSFNFDPMTGFETQNVKVLDKSMTPVV